MLAEVLARRLARLGIHYAWAIVALAFATSLATAGALALPAVMILPLNREFGWSTQAIASAVALRLLLYGAMAPFAASLIDRIGLRRAALGAMLLIAAGFLASLGMREPGNSSRCGASSLDWAPASPPL